jgi:hypothetical protein
VYAWVPCSILSLWFPPVLFELDCDSAPVLIGDQSNSDSEIRPDVCVCGTLFSESEICACMCDVPDAYAYISCAPGCSLACGVDVLGGVHSKSDSEIGAFDVFDACIPCSCCSRVYETGDLGGDSGGLPDEMLRLFAPRVFMLYGCELGGDCDHVVGDAYSE